MTTWADLQRHMRAKYRLHDDQAEMMSMVWSYGDDDRTQKIIVRRFEAAERVMVEFKSPFARYGQVEPETLLRENAKLPLGTVALSGDVFFVIYNALMENMDIGDFDFLLARIAAVADTLGGTVRPSGYILKPADQVLCSLAGQTLSGYADVVRGAVLRVFRG